MQEERMLEIISNETKDKVCNLDVITPEIFAEIFVENAKKHNIESYEEFLRNYMETKVSNFLYIQDETTKKADKLSKTTSKAIEAIVEKNDESLKEVLVETKQLRKEIEKLKKSLYKDELTGVYNRKWMFDRMVQKDSNVFAKDGVLGLVDLNYFKLVNDTYGHIIGDKVLVFVSAQLRKIRASVVRYGGDEFIVLFDSKVSIDEVRKKLTDLREDLLKKHLKAKDAEFKISYSVGVSEFKTGDRVDEVVEKADEDMYDDKKAIKERVKGIDI